LAWEFISPISLLGRFLALSQAKQKENSAMSSQVRIVKKNEIRDRQPVSRDSKGGDAARDREIVAVVKGWIQEFKLRSERATGIALAQPE
jgi:hypothetical protein